MPVVRAMLQLAEVGSDDIVFDLGSGDGRIPITAAREFGAHGVGIEIDPALVEVARINAQEAGVQDRVEFRLGDMYAADVRAATVVALFLHPRPNLKLRPKLLSQLEPGSRVVSYIWDMGDWTPDQERTVNGRRIYLWRVPERTRISRSAIDGIDLLFSPAQAGPLPRPQPSAPPRGLSWHHANEGALRVRCPAGKVASKRDPGGDSQEQRDAGSRRIRHRAGHIPAEHHARQHTDGGADARPQEPRLRSSVSSVIDSRGIVALGPG
jgi:SAM-dependent methyltransferase